MMNEVDKMVQELRAEFEFSEKDSGNRMVIFGFFSALLLADRLAGELAIIKKAVEDAGSDRGSEFDWKILDRLYDQGETITNLQAENERLRAEKIAMMEDRLAKGREEVVKLEAIKANLVAMGKALGYED